MLALVLPSFHCIELNCVYGLYQDWPIKNFYTCKAENVNVIDDNTSITSVTKSHSLGKANDDVEVFEATQQTLKFLPKGIQNFFPNLKGITISSSKLRTIRRKDIAKFQKLIFLYVPLNEIRTVDGDLFASNLGIEYISFSSNPLMLHVGHSLLEPLNYLKEVHFTSCNCISKNVQSPLLVDQMSLALAVNCPPTMKMLENQILGGESFDIEVSVRVALATEKLEIKNKELQESVNSLTSRLAELEKSFREMQANA